MLLTASLFQVPSHVAVLFPVLPFASFVAALVLFSKQKRQANYFKFYSCIEAGATNKILPILLTLSSPTLPVYECTINYYFFLPPSHFHCTIQKQQENTTGKIHTGLPSVSLEVILCVYQMRCIPCHLLPPRENPFIEHTEGVICQNVTTDCLYSVKSVNLCHY